MWSLNRSPVKHPLTDVAHLDFVGDDGGVVEADWGLPGETDGGVSHGLDDWAVGAAGNVTENNTDCGSDLQKIQIDYLTL